MARIDENGYNIPYSYSGENNFFYEGEKIDNVGTIDGSSTVDQSKYKVKTNLEIGKEDLDTNPFYKNEINSNINVFVEGQSYAYVETKRNIEEDQDINSIIKNKTNCSEFVEDEDQDINSINYYEIYSFSNLFVEDKSKVNDKENLLKDEEDQDLNSSNKNEIDSTINVSTVDKSKVIINENLLKVKEDQDLNLSNKNEKNTTKKKDCNQIPRFLRENIIPETDDLTNFYADPINKNQKQFLNRLRSSWESKTCDEALAYLIITKFSDVIRHYNYYIENFLSDDDLENLMKIFENNEHIICKRFKDFNDNYESLEPMHNKYSNLQKNDLKKRINNINMLIMKKPPYIQNKYLDYSTGSLSTLE